MKNMNPYFLAIFSIMFYLFFNKLSEIIEMTFISLPIVCELSGFIIFILAFIIFVLFAFLGLRIFNKLIKFINFKIVVLSSIIALSSPFLSYLLMDLLPGFYGHDVYVKSLTEFSEFSNYIKVLSTAVGYLFIGLLLIYSFGIHKKVEFSNNSELFKIAVLSIAVYLIFFNLLKVIGELHLFFFKNHPNSGISLLILLTVLATFIIFLFRTIFSKILEKSDNKTIISTLIVLILSIVAIPFFEWILAQFNTKNFNRIVFLSFYSKTTIIRSTAFYLLMILLCVSGFKFKNNNELKQI